MPSTVDDAEVRAELAGLLDAFFVAVSFQAGERPQYERLVRLFLDDGRLINNTTDVPEISAVRAFIAPRQALVDSGRLTAFEEAEVDGVTQVFGRIAHRLSTYVKRARRDGVASEARGVISTQFVWTPGGWRISSMAWDDERPGLRVDGVLGATS